MRAVDLAYIFLKKAVQEGKTITNLKLQKMVFIANGIYLAMTNEPLIEEKVEAWPYGPVIRPLYFAFNKFGSGEIKIGETEFSKVEPIEPTEAQKQAMDFTWQACRDFDGIRLSNWSHKEGSAWSKANKENLEIIPNDYIKDFFKQFVKPKQEEAV